MSIDIKYAIEQSREYLANAPPKTEAQKEAEFQDRLLRMQEDRSEYPWFYMKPGELLKQAQDK